MEQYTAKTLDELLKKVAAEKDVSVEDLVYYVTEEKTGFLGIGSSVSAEVYAPKDVVEFVERYLKTFFDGIALEAKVDVALDNNTIKVDIDAENNAVIIGRGGKSLEGLRLLVRHAVNAKFKRRFYLNLDINNYKNDRYQKLKSMAQRIAKQVQRSKVDVSLDPMPNDERRIMHKELTNFKYVRTQSEGSGRNRHLKIIYDATKE